MSAEQGAEDSQGVLHLASLDDPINHPGAISKFCCLEVAREFCAHSRLGGDSRTGKSDKCFGLGQDHVGDGRVARQNSGHCGIGENRDVRNAVPSTFIDRTGGFGHLHQAQKTFLHTCATRSAKNDDGALLFDTAFEGPRDFFARDRTHTSAHKVEVGDRRADIKPVNGRDPVDNAVVLSQLLASGVVLFLIVRKLERILALKARVFFLEGPFIERDFHALSPGEAVMVSAVRADVEVCREILREQRLFATFALHERQLG